MWCPNPGCETVCYVGNGSQLYCVVCRTCQTKICSGCRVPWHPNKPCSYLTNITPIFDSNLIKRPACCVPFEKYAGCDTVICKICKHKFC